MGKKAKVKVKEKKEKKIKTKKNILLSNILRPSRRNLLPSKKNTHNKHLYNR